MDARTHETTFEAWTQHFGVHRKNWPGIAPEPTGSSAALLSRWRKAPRRRIGQEAPESETVARSAGTRRPKLPADPVGKLAAAAAAEPVGKVVVETQPESLSTPPPEPGPGAAKGARGFVVLTIGLPGSGKTTWFKRRGVTPLSSDLLRTLLFDDITEQR